MSSSVYTKISNMQEDWIFGWDRVDQEDQSVEENYNEEESGTITGICDDKLLAIAKDIMDKYDEAFKELAK